MTAARTPDQPRTSDAIRAATIDADSTSVNGWPVPHPWYRNRLFGIADATPGSTAFSQDAPNPVVTP